ncbi:MAG: hypothetical protein JOZ29_02980, partial [Deltaproteobacteria bacterium]|nr:hypothetical protein [Deltaproteobacteria bacterium]
QRRHGVEAERSVQISSGPVEALIALSTDRCFPGQELALALELRMKPGWHVYGKPLPSNYQALELKLRSPLIAEQVMEFPVPELKRLAALNETLPVYGGEMRAAGKVGIRWSPPMKGAKFMEPLGDWIAPGTYQLSGELRFKACSDELCEPSQTIAFELPITLEAYVPPAPKQTA